MGVAQEEDVSISTQVDDGENLVILHFLILNTFSMF